MKRLLWVVVMLFVVFAPCAYADSIPTLNVNITFATVSMGPNDGSGDNVSFTLIGPGTNITGIGGMACFDWCSGPIPDLTFVGTSQIFLSGSFGSATIRGTNYDPETLSLCCLFSASGDLNSSVGGFVGEGDTFTQLNLTLPCCVSWGLNFVPVPPEGDFPGGFQFVHGELIAGTPPAATPEPGTLGLMATGLAGIVGVIRKKRLICRRKAT